MTNTFNLKIITPEKTIFADEINMAMIPSYEGDMSILKDHISIITFLRPGYIIINLTDQKKKFFVEEGTVEFFENKLLILSSSIKDINELSQNERQELIQLSEKKLKENISDKEKYEITHKIESLKEINQ